MVRKMTLTICLFGSCLWCLALVQRVDSAQPAPAASPSFKPVARVHSLMAGQSLVFKQINEALANSQAKHRTEMIEVFAEVLAELANVNTLNSEKEDYRGWAGQLRDLSLDLAAEAKKKKKAGEDRMKTLVSNLKNTCMSCHDAYQ